MIDSLNVPGLDEMSLAHPRNALCSLLRYIRAFFENFYSKKLIRLKLLHTFQIGISHGTNDGLLLAQGSIHSRLILLTYKASHWE